MNPILNVKLRHLCKYILGKQTHIGPELPQHLSVNLSKTHTIAWKRLDYIDIYVCTYVHVLQIACFC